MSYDKISNIFMEVFEKHAPLKYKYLRTNQFPFMAKVKKRKMFNDVSSTFHFFMEFSISCFVPSAILTFDNPGIQHGRENSRLA